MKNFLKILLVAVFAVVLLTGCGADETPTEPYLDFTSLEDFLGAYLAAKEGRGVQGFVERDWSGQTSVDWGVNIAERLNLTELETLYLPASIPDGFAIRKIQVGENYIDITYLPKDVIVNSRSEFWSAVINNPSFEFTIYRGLYNLDSYLQADNLTRDDLIDEKYYFWRQDSIMWEEAGVFVTMRVPTPSIDELETVKFLEIVPVNLTDTDEVLALIN
ncbi:MAG: hypothetical protein FWH20_06210 [Oscillospiraceae bacterium]|nr:hypothetical protein [Oscillospiraceae bacterium]